MSVAVRVPGLGDCERWDVKHLLAKPWYRTDDVFERFGAVADRRKEPHSGGLRYGSVHFDGEISLRDEFTSIAGQTWMARPGDIVFSKIDARNGAIGVLPDELGYLAFTDEFPIYDVSARGRLSAEFARLLLRTEVFRSQVDALAVGHSGRKRVPPEVFESLLIPVPDPSEQERVVKDYELAMEGAATVRSKANVLLHHAAVRLLEDLGIDYVRLERPPLAFVMLSHTLPRWSVRKGAELFQGVTSDITAAFPIARLGDHAELRRGISKSPQNRPGDNATPYIRVANVQMGYVDLSDMQYLDVTPRHIPAAALAKDDVLVCRNNSLELVGKAAPWYGEIDPCVHDDHVFSVRCDKTALNPSFLNAYLQTDFARAWFISEAQITTNLAGIAGSAVTELPIPLPSPEIQERLGEEYEQVHREGQELLARASDAEDAARALAEWEIATGRVAPT